MMFDAYTIPQDDYFEWDDVIQNNLCAYSHSIPYIPEYQTPTNCYPEVTCLNLGISEKLNPSPLEDYHFNWPETSHETPDSDDVTPSLPSHQKHANDLDSKSVESSPSPQTKEETLLQHGHSKSFYDDTYLFPISTRNVDYLAFDWHKCEDDIWATSRHLRRTKAEYDSEDLTYDRLTNACWRALSVGRLKLKKVNPRDFNWLKDQDTTWLHGPFVSHSPTPPLLEVPVESNELAVKSILKKPNLASLLCRGSIPSASHSLKISSSHSAVLGMRTKSKVRFSTDFHDSVAIDEGIDSSAAFSSNTHTKNKPSLGHFKSFENTDTRYKEIAIAPVNNLTEASMTQLDYMEEGSIICARDGEVNQYISSTKITDSLELLSFERYSNDMTPSICALRDIMIDTCHRGLGSLQHQSDFYLWPRLIT